MWGCGVGGGGGGACPVVMVMGEELGKGEISTVTSFVVICLSIYCFLLSKC